MYTFVNLSPDFRDQFMQFSFGFMKPHTSILFHVEHIVMKELQASKL